MKLSNVQNNLKTESEGVWVTYAGDLQVKLARIGSPAYEKLLRKLSKPHTRQLRDNSLDNDVAELMTQKAIARHILLDWKGVEDDAGKEVLYSEKKALEILTDPKYRDFYRDILAMAQERATFNKEDTTDASKN